ncbi:brix domain protein [Teladorsagia circumcincta]|uniref:Ribosome biogenesis protein BRX1 homolog n=1 Tax=Teladorsagia circumcincta TaxID=45464 RepID=A0A2G9TW64_TELCI|nr:brix domain protein [Teladorsagia circumcincta]
MNDIKVLLPHAKGDSKLDRQKSLVVINEIAEMKNCTKVLYFESRKHKDVYLWMSNVDNGPSVKFLVHNMHTMMEMKLSGNCLKASRPILSFDSRFDEEPHLTLIKHALMQTFGTPNHHPRSQPFFDHVFSFSVTPDLKIWFRNFQIVDETLQLQEIGPRFVLETIRIFAGSFEGAVLYDNPDYESPNAKRRAIKLLGKGKYIEKQLSKKAALSKAQQIKEVIAEKVEDPVGEVFEVKDEPLDEDAKRIVSMIEKKKKKKKFRGRVEKRKAEVGDAKAQINSFCYTQDSKGSGVSRSSEIKKEPEDEDKSKQRDSSTKSYGLEKRPKKEAEDDEGPEGESAMKSKERWGASEGWGSDKKAAPPKEKEKVNLGVSGKLAEDTNMYRGVLIKYNEPPEAKKPTIRYVELKEKDVLKFGFSSREFVVLNEKSAGDDGASDAEPGKSPGSE